MSDNKELPFWILTVDSYLVFPCTLYIWMYWILLESGVYYWNILDTYMDLYTELYMDLYVDLYMDLYTEVFLIFCTFYTNFYMLMFY